MQCAALPSPPADTVHHPSEWPTCRAHGRALPWAGGCCPLAALWIAAGGRGGRAAASVACERVATRIWLGAGPRRCMCCARLRSRRGVWFWASGGPGPENAFCWLLALQQGSGSRHAAGRELHPGPALLPRPSPRRAISPVCYERLIWPAEPNVTLPGGEPGSTS